MIRTVSRRARTIGVGLVAVAVTGLGTPFSAAAADHGGHGGQGHHPHSHRAGSFAVIGDLPYGQADLGALPGWVDDINSDPDVSSVAHLGDIKSGSSQCADGYFTTIRTQFDRFADPLVYTPGDNEWTDCHRASNGGYDPLERLATLRDVFFGRPGTTLGQRPVRVASQADDGFPENVRYRHYGLSFAALHVVGSNNDLAPWDGTDPTITEPNGRQVIEEFQRMSATIELMREAFSAAKKRPTRAVVLLMQADMFDESYGGTEAASFSDYSAFAPLVQAIITESSAYDGPVYLLNGDSHEYRSDAPLAAGSPWLEFYGVAGDTNNLTRVVVDGSSQAGQGYLKVTVAPRRRDGDVLSWQQTPYPSTSSQP